jgi:hypothetical protein
VRYFFNCCRRICWFTSETLIYIRCRFSSHRLLACGDIMGPFAWYTHTCSCRTQNELDSLRILYICILFILCLVGSCFCFVDLYVCLACSCRTILLLCCVLLQGDAYLFMCHLCCRRTFVHLFVLCVVARRCLIMYVSCVLSKYVYIHLYVIFILAGRYC